MNIMLGSEIETEIKKAVNSGKFSSIPDDELEKDKQEAYADILACEAALHLGIKHDGKYDIKYRLEENKKQIRIIESEQTRRNK